MSLMCIRVSFWIGMSRLEEWKNGRVEGWMIGQINILEILDNI